jgi:hypothetical protein
MTEIINIVLRDARPDDRVHLLLWDTCNTVQIRQLAFNNNAHLVNYRESLLQRINKDEEFLALHHELDRELAAIKSICSRVSKPMVLLEGLDCLITYLQVHSGSHITLFWKNLEQTRKLERLLWILLPHQLAPKSWPEKRKAQIPSG